MKLTRNDLCWCGSQKKYKKCHLDFDQKIEAYALKGYHTPEPSMIKTPAQITGIKASAQINTAVLDHVAAQITEGMSTLAIDTLVHDFTIAHGAIPAPLGFNGFPKSCCTSINDVVCHGIPSAEVILKQGDILNVDVSTIYQGYYSDASRMFTIGNISPERAKLVAVAKESLLRGLFAAKPWGSVGDIGHAVQTYVESQGCSVVTAFGGHGIGIDFHEEPFIPHVGEKGTDMLLVPGMIFTIEPMVNAGKAPLYVDATDKWTARTKDESDSAQWEYTVLITEDGNEILTY